MCMSVCPVHTFKGYCVHADPEEGTENVGSSGPGMTDTWELPCGCKKPNQAVLEGQPVPSHQMTTFLLSLL